MLFVTTLVVVILSLFLLSACDTDRSSDREYGLYVSRIDYDEEARTMTAIVALTSQESQKLDGLKADWHFERHKINSFYNEYNYTVSLNPSTIFSVVDFSLTQEQRKINDVEFDVLKVTFEYATIYKSMNSAGTRVKSGRSYLHDFALDEQEEDMRIELSIISQNSAAWYGVLIAAAVVGLGVVVAIVLIRREKYAKQERTEDK